MTDVALRSENLARAFGGFIPDLDLHCQRVIRSAKAMVMEPPVTAGEIADLAKRDPNVIILQDEITRRLARATPAAGIAGSDQRLMTRGAQAN